MMKAIQFFVCYGLILVSTSSDHTTDNTTDDPTDNETRNMADNTTVIVGTVLAFVVLVCLGFLLAIFLATVAKKFKARTINTPQAMVTLDKENHQTEQHEYQYVSNNLPKHSITEGYETPVQTYDSIVHSGYLNEDPYFQPASSKNDIISQLTQDIKISLVNKEDLNLDKVLGSGEFGTVYRAVWSLRDQDSDSKVEKEVAVKTMDTEDSHDDDVVKFLQEAAIMGQFHHPSILKILGIVLTDPVMIIVDIMEGGDLHNHLCKNFRNNLHNFDIHELKGLLLSYSRQICCAMTLLEKKGYIHRDLAARNILVSRDGTNCKISDFGLSRELQSESFYLSHGGKVPVKWTAPEALLYRLYSAESDVWSYGCLLYEIWSLGYKPFHDMDNKKVIDHVQKGNRLPPPPGCPRVVYEVMIHCWHPDASERGGFNQVSPPLLKPDFIILKWSKEDVLEYDKEMRTLGAPLEKGLGLFKELQHTYCDKN